MYKLNGNTLPLDTAFTVGEGDEAIQYPANWLRLSTAEEKEALGIVEIVPEQRLDDRFYFISDNGDGTFSNIPRDLSILKTQFISAVKASMRASLSATDWVIVRASDPTSGKEIPQSVTNERNKIRTDGQDMIAAITAATTLEELIAIT